MLALLAPSLPSRQLPSATPLADQFHRALDARDARFDGVFYVGIVTTGIYCRPICPSRRANPDHRRFFDSAAAAECAGFRPCLRCRPELAPGGAAADAVPRLAIDAARRIAAGALNGRSVAELASELGVGERHLRRALRLEAGVSPIELAQTHRLLFARALLGDSALSVTDVAFASGFQSLRRFNVAFRARYGTSPSALRRPPRRAAGATHSAETPAGDLVRLELAYRAPFAWPALLDALGGAAIPRTEIVRGRRYGRTVRLGDRRGVVFVEDAPRAAKLRVELSAALVPALMPLVARLRQLFDLDAEPAVIDAHLEREGLALLVRRRPGVRLPGAFDGFEVALRSLLVAPEGGTAPHRAERLALLARVATVLGEPVAGCDPQLDRLAPSAERVADAGLGGLAALGLSRRRAEALLALARAVACGSLRLAPGSDVAETRRALAEVADLGEPAATTIVMRALHWPDVFPVADRALQRASGVTRPDLLRARAERWRPWRSYVAQRLWLERSSLPSSGGA